eukprot:scaffold9535_cov96-Isochrysis_galbana.AAC.3
MPPSRHLGTQTHTHANLVKKSKSPTLHDALNDTANRLHSAQSDVLHTYKPQLTAVSLGPSTSPRLTSALSTPPPPPHPLRSRRQRRRSPANHQVVRCSRRQERRLSCVSHTQVENPHKRHRVEGRRRWRLRRGRNASSPPHTHRPSLCGPQEPAPVARLIPSTVCDRHIKTNRAMAMHFAAPCKRRRPSHAAPRRRLPPPP